MKKNVILFVCLFFASSLFGQTIFNKAYQNVNELSDRFISEIYGDLYFTGINYDVNDFGNCYLYKHDSQGQLKFRLPILKTITVSAFFKSLDNKLIISGVAMKFDCDVIGNTQTNFLIKLDTNGTAIFTSTYSMKYTENPSAVLQLSDSSYVSFTDSTLIKHNKNGQYNSSLNLNISAISSAIHLQNGNFLVSGKLLGNISLIELSPNGTIISSKPFSTNLTKFQFYHAQQVLALGGDNKLYKISPAMELISQSSFNNVTLVNDFTYFNDSIFTITSDLNFTSNYLICDTSFNSLLLSSTSTSNFEQTAIHVSLSQVDILAIGMAAIAGTSPISFPQSFVSLSKLNKHASHNFDNDVQLLSVEVDSLYTISYPSSIPYTYQSTSYLRAKVKIKNNGNSVLTNFILNKFEFFPFDCGVTFFEEKISNFALAPGDSVILKSIGFAQRSLSLVTLGSTINIDECFYVSLPNGETDKTFEDNKVCKNLNILITSLDKNTSDPVFFSIGPVPFEDELNIESDSEMKNLKIINTLGQILQTEEANSKQVTINLKQLANGMYYIQIETEKGIAIKKVLKN